MNNHQRPRLVALVRISKDRDDETSTATQPREMQTWADAHGMDIVETMEEHGRSGFKTIPRPRLDDAIGMVRNGLADGIIVWKLDRFTRKGAIEIFRMIALVTEHGGFLIATQDDIDTRRTGMADIIKLTVIAELAKGESLARSDRTSAWHRHRRREVAPPVGRRPYGYDRTKANTLTVDHNEAKVIRKMADDVLSGRSMRSMLVELNATCQRKDDDRPWSHHAIKHILTSPTTMGGRMIDGTFMRGDWEAILDAETVDAITTIVTDPSRKVSTTNKVRNLLPGIATCGTPGCEGKIKSRNAGGRSKRPRYFCNVCHSSVQAPEADAAVQAVVLDALAGEAWKELRASGRTHDASAVQFLTDRLAHAKQRWMDGKDSDADYDETKDEINARIAAIQSAPVVELPDVDDIATAWPKLNVTARRQVLMAACESIVIMPYTQGANANDRTITTVR